MISIESVGLARTQGRTYDCANRHKAIKYGVHLVFLRPWNSLVPGEVMKAQPAKVAA